MNNWGKGCIFGVMLQHTETQANERSSHSTTYLQRAQKASKAILCPKKEPKYKASPKHNIPESNLRYYQEIEGIMKFTAKYIVELIKLQGLSLNKFEKLCAKHGYELHRRSLYGLIRGDRGDFRLSYFAVPLGLLGVTLNDVFRAYVKYLDEIEEEK